MKISCFIISILVLLSFLYSSNAHFFPNISSIPSNLNPKASPWENFNKLIGCRHGQKVEGLSKLKQYFEYFGYLNKNTSFFNFTDDFDFDLESAVKTYQLNFNLNVSGEIDEKTLEHIQRPRCGNPDMVNGTTTMNSGRPSSPKSVHTVAHYSFFPGRPRWPASKTALTYAFLPENELSVEVKRVFGNAFERWSEVIPLTFSETASFGSADIRIGFYSGDHGDGEPFDGAMGTLAHAFSPPTGRFHLDFDENWVVDGDFIKAPSSVVASFDLESVAVHEIGHLLGLGHSSVEGSIMYPTISANTRKVDLAEDDVQGIQTLYGSNPDYNGSLPSLNPSPWGQDTGGAQTSAGSFWSLLLIIGFAFTPLFVL